MKNLTKMFMLVSLFIIFPILTNAESITNINGIEISEEEYNNFSKIHTHDYIMTMNQEKYEKLKSLDYSNVVTETKYVQSTYNRSLNLTTENEITEEEYNNFSKGNSSSRLSDAGQQYESVAKRLVMALAGGTTWNYVTLSATWKYIPSTRSFDVIGMRGIDVNFRNGSQNGEQIYLLDGSYIVIDYDWNGTNSKRADDGFGISMNIVNSDIQALQLAVECDISTDSTTPEIFGSYQHAVSNVSLATSQNYTFGGGGLGNVFVYPYSISQKYDGMSGVRIVY